MSLELPWRAAGVGGAQLHGGLQTKTLCSSVLYCDVAFFCNILFQMVCLLALGKGSVGGEGKQQNKTVWPLFNLVFTPNIRCRAPFTHWCTRKPYLNRSHNKALVFCSFSGCESPVCCLESPPSCVLSPNISISPSASRDGP